MKKVLYTLLAVSIIFAACKKEDDTPVVVNGCMDSTQFNYNASANTDDGSCIAFFYGCMDSTQLNYTVLANTDDGSCIDVILGCMDEIATNYYILATVDDGSCIYGIVGFWTPTSVDLDSSQTVTINGETIYELDGELLTFSGSQTMTPEEADIEGDIEFTSDEKMFIDGDLIGDYTYSNNILTIDDGYEIQEMSCSFTSTDLTLTMSEGMDTAWVEPGIGDITASAYWGMTINCSRNTAANTNVNQRVGNTDYNWFVKPQFNKAKLINSIKQK